MNIQNILFLDIETVSEYADYNELPNDWRELWQSKANAIMSKNPNETIESSYQKAALYAEFGKIVCITCGSMMKDNEPIKIKSFYDDDEHALLTEFAAMLNKWSPASGGGEKVLCAHNGKEFDFPFICRRMIINDIKIPGILNISGKKPWEIKHLDTLELWKFGDFKNYTSLNVLAKVLGIPSPKDDIDGSMVNEIYWKEKNLPRIEIYCKKDVGTLAKVFLRIQQT